MTDYDDLISETLGEMVETEEALLAIHLSDRFKAELERIKLDIGFTPFYPLPDEVIKMVLLADMRAKGLNK